MFKVRHYVILVLSITLLLVGTVYGDPTYTATPAVAATAMPYGGTVVTEEFETPVSPLLAEATSSSGGNSGWAQAAPGRLRATSVIANASEPWYNSQGVAKFVDNFRLDNPAMPDNTTGAFFFRFYLTGTMRILASDPESNAMVNVGGSTILGGSVSGQLNFGRIGGVPTLYAVSGGGGNPLDNILAWPDGTMKVYGTTTGQTGGYYEIQVGVPVAFFFSNMPINTNPPVDDWKNQVEVRMSAVSFSNAECDFSSTFEFAPQNPIVPDPEAAGMPVTGWDLGTASDEIVLPPLLTVATSTGSGQAAFLGERGTISGLTARTLADFPVGLTGGDFANGWFSLQVDLLAGGGDCDVAINLPVAAGTGATWWCHDGEGWEGILLDYDEGDTWVLLRTVDNGPGDADPTEGVVLLAGGISDEEPLPSMLSVFQAVWRDGAVDLSWRAPGADPGLLSLEAHLGVESWLVPLTADGQGGFVARDEASTLTGGGSVRYDLRFDGMLLDSRTVQVPGLAVARLDRVAPNPFNPRIEIAYSIPRDAGSIELAIHDLMGRRVATLVDADPGPGAHLVVWEGLDAAGRAVPSGTYLVKLMDGQRVETRKISLVR